MNKEESTPTAALNKLADYLAKRDHSETELRQKLSRRFNNEHIDWAIQEAQNSHWIRDPQELAQSVAQELHRKKKGYLYILRYLAQKGLPSIPPESELEVDKARQVALDKMKKKSHFSYEERQKLGAQLQRRGFTSETIQSVIYEK